ncbi:hypothetical protein KAFR_0D03050 [Kazachstania africana CBS 2517]|uniref:SRP9 domain-containing protein n=1 Tax=Kazachstania africana (strain ATCC 22294 / BCRC 22015 / CBS 2517 / CECT 1963 / NBRC 1671 / NRRL Y-8276) TaxID=1071382 RepID=H2AUA3_KAZAF|nr:hypothetical protein KAFR_0D03050 [Kazachstania africana CBS 2517]CCF57953.1 hypothetical protein KAFR_0D03050 [Kazachstania africana CBS 2517]
MSVKPIDTFIVNGIRLFEINPSQSTISITYNPKNGKKEKSSNVSFKIHNPHLNTNYKFRTNKSKDVSKLLNSLGPRGVTIIPKRKITKKLLHADKTSKKIKTINTVGLSAFMANTKVKEYIPETKAAPATTNLSKKKKSKSRNKKKH